MQTLRKRTSPCKYKNDPSRFLGEGITFKAKLIGILEVSEARGDKMCQDALNDLKTAIRAAGEHKQRITISISIDGLKLRDEKTGDCLYHHPVHKISFIAQDMSDSRAFGYIFGSPDTGHRFFGIKTDKTASQVVISMRDLFQVVFELKKKEIEMAKHHTEHHHTKYGSTGYLDSLHFSKNNNEPEKGKGKYSQMVKSKCMSSKANESFSGMDLRGAAAEAIADLLDLEHELNNIQQGISQMEKITPSDPFGPLSKGDSYDPFDDSFSSKTDQPLKDKSSLITKLQLQAEDTKEIEENSSLFLPSVSADKTNFFPQFSPTKNKSKVNEDKWFEHDSEAFFDEATYVNDVEFTTSPAVLNSSGPASEQEEGRRSPVKIDLFTELDPLGTGRVKPYVDKKDFFQELKNPPKKLLKEMIVDTTSELSVLYFPAQHKEKTTSTVNSESYTHTLDPAQILKESTFQKNYTNIDPFGDGDSFERIDPFQEENFSTSEAFAPLFSAKSLTSDNFDEKTWKFDESKEFAEEKFDREVSVTPPLFSSGTLKVSLPPENYETKSYATSSKTYELKSPPNSPENLKTISKKSGQILKQGNLEKSEEVATQEKLSINVKVKNSEPKSKADNLSSNIKFFTALGTIDKIRCSNEALDSTTPDPPPRAKTALFSIKPPPLPPKKQIQLITKPPARPPLEDTLNHYDYLKQKDVLKTEPEVKEELKCVKLKQHLFNAKELFPKELKKKTTESGFPVLPPPPPQKKVPYDLNRKSVTKKEEREKEVVSTEGDGSILNIQLRQLDKTGLENLAATLGIPLENIYSMTLQDLTKMLSDKYLPSSSKKPENKVNDSFEADFESNFGNIYSKEENVAYDKYAVFKELIKSENELGQNDIEKIKKNNICSLKEEINTKGEVPQEEDKYAALRLLSLNSQFNQFSADDDDDDYNTILKTDKICDSNSSTEKLAFHGNDVKSEKVVQNFENKMENLEEKIVKTGGTEDLAPTKSPEYDSEIRTHFTSENQIFPVKDEFYNDKNICLDKNNWATFDKLNFEETITKKSSDLFEDNENSPFSSDGKEELREIPFCWHENDFLKKTRKDVPWRDEDESWEEDYSPKESFCSDESSHEEHSPKSRRDEIFMKQRNRRGVCTKSSRNKSSKNNNWSHREKWQEETEDEFEGSWTKHRGKISSYDLEKKNTWRGNNREECNKHCDWSSSRDGLRTDEKRYSHHYGNRCKKRSESDNEYRKRCDSDTSEKEYAWTFRKNCAESHGRSEKTKQYHSSDLSFRDCPEYCHKSRSKYRRGGFQKRPNSSSESKRNSEKSFFSPGHSIREGDKTYPGKKESNLEFFKCDHGFKESRYIDDVGFERFCSHDRKELSHHHSKSCCRNNGRPSEIYSPLGKRFETSNEEYQFYERETENKYDKANDEHFNFDGEFENFGSSNRTERESRQTFLKPSDRRQQKMLNSKNEKISDNGFFPFTNSNDNNFKDFKTCPSKSDAKPERTICDSKKLQSKNQIVDLELQASTGNTLRKSDSINIFSRDKDPFEGDDFFSSVS